MTPSLRLVVGSAAAIVHVGIVVAVISTPFPHNVPAAAIRKPLQLYQNVSGLFRDYAFFAPRVGTDLRAALVLELESGGSEVISLTSDNREAAFRYNNIVVSSMRDERGRDLFASSWAASALGARPDAVSVTVVVEGMFLPEMREYRAGARPEWKLVYAGAFDRRDVGIDEGQ